MSSRQALNDVHFKLTTRNVTKLISSNLELHTLSQGRPARVVTAMTMLKQYLYRYQGHIGAYLVVGGVDATGPQLFTVHAHGSTDKLPYVTMGSGSLAAMAVFESAYKENLTRKEAIALVARAIRAGVFNDLGSGSNVDVCVITKSGTEMLRNYEKPVSIRAGRRALLVIALAPRMGKGQVHRCASVRCRGLFSRKPPNLILCPRPEGGRSVIVLHS